MSSPAASEEPVARLPLADGGPPPLRADAQRNRERVLCAAATVIERSGPAGLTMEAVAEEAGVGKGTVFRRFGDRSTLLRALLDEEERRLQDAVISGEPPLGPGAPPAERLAAFGQARLDHLIRHSELLSIAELRAGDGAPPAADLSARVHVAHLLRLAGLPTEDASVTAAALLAFLSGARVFHLITAEGHDAATLHRTWRRLAGAAIEP